MPENVQRPGASALFTLALEIKICVLTFANDMTTRVKVALLLAESIKDEDKI